MLFHVSFVPLVSSSRGTVPRALKRPANQPKYGTGQVNLLGNTLIRSEDAAKPPKAPIREQRPDDVGNSHLQSKACSLFACSLLLAGEPKGVKFATLWLTMSQLNSPPRWWLLHHLQ